MFNGILIFYKVVLFYNQGLKPPDWHIPVRQSLVAVLHDAGRPTEAEFLYWQDLQQIPENGWSLFGLTQSLRAQGKNAQAAEFEARLEEAWRHADVTLPASRIMDEG